MVQKLYVIFIGILIALFVGVGVAAFYPSPKSPEYPAALSQPTDKPDSAEMVAQRAAYDQATKDYDAKFKAYNRNLSLIVLGAALALLVISLTVLKDVDLMADGVLLGGVLTLIYSIVRGFGAGDNAFRFVLVSAGLAAALVLGWLKFARPAAATTKRKRA